MVDALNKLVEKHRRWGFWKGDARLRNQGRIWNPKRTYRVYCKLALNLPRRTKKRLGLRLRQPLEAPAAVNAVWALDFMSGALWSGRRFRTLNALNEGVREGLAIEVDTNPPAKRVVRVLERLGEVRGLPLALRMDNGPEFIAQELVDWCQARGIAMRYIQPGKPDQNAYIERFNRTVRDEVLNAYVFEDLDQVREITSAWLRTYNEERPHEALGSLPPARFRAKIEESKNSTSDLST